MISLHSAAAGMVVMGLIGVLFGSWLTRALTGRIEPTPADEPAETQRGPLQIEGAPAVPIELPGAPEPEPEAPEIDAMEVLGRPSSMRLGRVRHRTYDPREFVTTLYCVACHPMVEGQPYWDIELPEDPDSVLAVCEAHSYYAPTPEG